MTRHHHKQRGMALLIALIVLVVVSILGATAMRSALFQNRMSINSQLSQMTFQGAESGLQAVIDQASATPRSDPTNPFRIVQSPPGGNPMQFALRVCYDATGASVTDDEATRAQVDGELVFDYTECPDLPDTPISVTSVIAIPPDGIPNEVVEGHSLCGSTTTCFSLTSIYTRAYASIAGVSSRSSHVQVWGIVQVSENN